MTESLTCAGAASEGDIAEGSTGYTVDIGTTGYCCCVFARGELFGDLGGAFDRCWVLS